MHLLLNIESLDNTNSITGMWIVIGVVFMYALVKTYTGIYLDRKREKYEDYESKIYHED